MKSTFDGGGLGERLKREYRLKPDPAVALATLVETEQAAPRWKEIWGGYIAIAQAYHLPFLATTPTRRANRERIGCSGFGDPILKDNVAFLQKLKAESSAAMYVGGLMGCRGDAYTGEGRWVSGRPGHSTAGRRSGLRRREWIFHGGDHAHRARGRRHGAPWRKPACLT